MIKSNPGTILAALVLITTVAFPGLMNAALITQTQNFDFFSALDSSNGENSESLTFDRFDPAMGQLTSVDFSLSGALEIAGSLPTSFIFTGSGIQAVPYQYQISFNLGIDGLEFSNSPSFNFSGTSPGFPAVLLVADAFNSISYNASITPATDAAGGAPIQDDTVSAPFLMPLAPGSAAYISPDQLQNNSSDFLSATAGSTDPFVLAPSLSYLAILPDGLVGTATLSGDISLVYEYVELAIIPLPAAFWLFLSVLVPMAFYLRSAASMRALRV